MLGRENRGAERGIPNSAEGCDFRFLQLSEEGRKINDLHRFKGEKGAFFTPNSALSGYPADSGRFGREKRVRQ